MQKTYELRKFTIKDLHRVIHINSVCLPENYTDYFFINLHRKFPETFIVAEDNGDIVGYIMCRVELGLSNFGFSGLVKKGHVVSVAVLPQYRRKGIGKALVTKVIESMRLYKAKQLFLEVRLTNTPAISLYKKLGFKGTRVIEGYYADGECAQVMSRKLN